MRESWTDDRLDDLNGKVDALRVEMKADFDKVDRRFERVEGRIDDLHRTMLQLGGGAIATVVVGFAGVIATQL